MKHTHVRSPVRERKVLFLKQTLNRCTIRRRIPRHFGQIIKPASHVVDEMEITYLRCILRTVFVGSIVGRQEMLKLNPIEALYRIVAALLCKYILLRLRNPIKVDLLSADESIPFPDAQLCLGDSSEKIVLPVTWRTALVLVPSAP